MTYFVNEPAFQDRGQGSEYIIFFPEYMMYLIYLPINY